MLFCNILGKYILWGNLCNNSLEISGQAIAGNVVMEDIKVHGRGSHLTKVKYKSSKCTLLS